MIKRIKLGEKEIILVGTAHISKESIILAQETIEKEQPDVIGVELDKERLAQLLSGNKWQETNIIEIIQSGRTELFLLNILLSNMQRSLGEHVGVKPGAEMLIAIQKAQELKKPIQLLDRDVKVTLKRAFSAMGIIEKAKLGGSILGSFFGVGEKVTIEKIEELKKEDLLNNLMKELGKQFPSIKKVLVDERDSYTAEMIKHSPGKRIVAIVGAGHLSGIIENIKSGKKINLQELGTVKKGTNWMKLLGIVIPIVFVILLGWAFCTKGIGTTFNMLGYWILITGGFSAIGALLARAHPITIGAAFVAAPITTLHPALAAGWISGLVEAKYNPPKVLDFEKLPDVSSLGGFYKNKVTHILIVAALTNIGATIGLIVAFPTLVAMLA
ncbi:MAG: TraB/GumN family protein [Candidatus Diapherotrites archaeon]|nr:TraB/GumN family protein [Candidatus Diapherotrites archaeon]